VIHPDGDDYYVTTNVYRRGTLDWAWEVTLRQSPFKYLRMELDEDGGSRLTEKAAKRKADRVAQRMMRAAASWTSRTYKHEESQP
jgi:hypothetical protein